MIDLFFKFVIPIIPIASLGLFIQALTAWINPENVIAMNFHAMASTLFLSEFVFMHSSVFYESRKTLLKKKWAQRLFAVVLFLVYGLFLIDLAQKNLVIGVNYLILNISRLFAKEKRTSYPSGIDKSAQASLPGLAILLKLSYFALGLPLLINSLPLPDGGMSADLLKSLHPEIQDISFLILITKTFTVYFAGEVILSLLNSFKRQDDGKPTLLRVIEKLDEMIVNLSVRGLRGRDKNELD